MHTCTVLIADTDRGSCHDQGADFAVGFAEPHEVSPGPTAQPLPLSRDALKSPIMSGSLIAPLSRLCGVSGHAGGGLGLGILEAFSSLYDSINLLHLTAGKSWRQTCGPMDSSTARSSFFLIFIIQTWSEDPWVDFRAFPSALSTALRDTMQGGWVGVGLKGLKGLFQSQRFFVSSSSTPQPTSAET